jgi:hypothetical protein
MLALGGYRGVRIVTLADYLGTRMTRQGSPR